MHVPAVHCFPLTWNETEFTKMRARERRRKKAIEWNAYRGEKARKLWVVLISISFVFNVIANVKRWIQIGQSFRGVAPFVSHVKWVNRLNGIENTVMYTEWSWSVCCDTENWNGITTRSQKLINQRRIICLTNYCWQHFMCCFNSVLLRLPVHRIFFSFYFCPWYCHRHADSTYKLDLKLAKQ